jgi:hypothetical protein
LSLDTQKANRQAAEGKVEKRRRSSIEVGTLTSGHLGSMIGRAKRGTSCREGTRFFLALPRQSIFKTPQNSFRDLKRFRLSNQNVLFVGLPLGIVRL